jgi:hypothetical protein
MSRLLYSCERLADCPECGVPAGERCRTGKATTARPFSRFPHMRRQRANIQRARIALRAARGVK